MTLPAVNSLPSIDTLLETLQRGGVVITATQRLARHLIQQVSLRQSEVIEKPAILSIESWLIETWSQIEEVSENPRRMLSTAEASELWRRVIEDHTATERSFSLLQSESAAQLAARCRVALKTHSVSMAYERNRRLFQSEIDTKNFLAWLDAFDSRLVRERWLLLEDTYEIIAKGAEMEASEVLFLSEEVPGPALSEALNQCFDKCTWHHSKALDEQLETHAFDLAAENLWSLILSGPRDRYLHYSNERPDEQELLRSIGHGLRVFLKAYGSDPDGQIAALDNYISAKTESLQQKE